MYPQQTYFNQNMYNSPRVTVPSVLNKESAKAYPMPNNSSILLLEEQTDHIFFVQTDSAGTKQITTYQLVPYKEPEPIDLNDLNGRMNKMESVQQKILSMLEGINAKSDTSTNAG